MRVITGSARGRRLITVPGAELVRPTPERVKEAMFSSIQFDIEGRRVLDLFAGCGQLGIEALSRGAESAVFVDASDVSLNTVKENLQNTGLAGKAKTVRADFAVFFARNTEKFDIIFLDPPYKSGFLTDALNGAVSVASDGCVIFCEHPKEVELPQKSGDFSVFKNYRFGKIFVTVYRKEDAAQ